MDQDDQETVESETAQEAPRDQKKPGRKGFREFALALVAEAKQDRVTPVTKEEMDDLWGMNSVIPPGPERQRPLGTRTVEC